VVMISIFNC